MTTTPEAMRESAARWHDQRRRDTPDAFEMEFHEVSARAIRAIPIDLPPQPTPDPHAEEWHSKAVHEAMKQAVVRLTERASHAEALAKALEPFAHVGKQLAWSKSIGAWTGRNYIDTQGYCVSLTLYPEHFFTALAALEALPLPLPAPDPHAEALAKALELLLPGDAVMEQILWGDKPDDALGTSTFKMGDLRQARTSLDAYKARKEQG